MSWLGELWPFVSLGLLGALHCAGMCGGFALLVAGSGRSSAVRLLARQSTYLLGKALCYAVVGLGLSLGIRGMAASTGELHGLRVAAGGVAGVLLVLLGLQQLGLRWPRRGGRYGASLAGRVRAGLGSLFECVRTLPGWAGAFGTGLLNGLVPCGLSLSAWILASQATPASAFVGSFLFGVTTAPALLAVALGSSLTRSVASGRLRRATPLLLGAALVVFGGLGILRAARAWRAPGVAHTADCCPAPLLIGATR